MKTITQGKAGRFDSRKSSFCFNLPLESMLKDCEKGIVLSVSPILAHQDTTKKAVQLFKEGINDDFLASLGQQFVNKSFEVLVSFVNKSYRALDEQDLWWLPSYTMSSDFYHSITMQTITNPKGEELLEVKVEMPTCYIPTPIKVAPFTNIYNLHGISPWWTNLQDIPEETLSDYMGFLMKTAYSGHLSLEYNDCPDAESSFLTLIFQNQARYSLLKDHAYKQQIDDLLFNSPTKLNGA